MCSACEFKRLHGPLDWDQHPYAGHGYNGTAWTHPDLADGTQAGAARPRQISGEVGRAEAAPAAVEV